MNKQEIKTIKAIRRATGAGVRECKEAFTHFGYHIEAGADWLKMCSQPVVRWYEGHPMTKLDMVKIIKSKYGIRD